MDKNDENNMQSIESEQTEPVRETNESPFAQNKSKLPMILGVLLVLALLGCGVLGWLWYGQMTQNAVLEDKVATAENNVKASFESLEALEANVADQEQASESDAIISAALAYASAPLDSAGMKFVAEIKKQVDDFAGVDVTSDTSGFGMVLKKVDDQWVVVASGQDAPAQEDIDLYGIPEEVYSWQE